MQRVKIYNDLLHLTGEWMNADMLNRGTEDPQSLSLSLSLSLFFFFFLGGANVPSAPLWIRHCISQYQLSYWNVTNPNYKLTNLRKEANKNGVRSLFWQPIIPTAHCSDGPVFRQPIAPTAHFSDSPFLRQPIIPSKMVKSSIIILKPVVFFL